MQNEDERKFTYADFKKIEKRCETVINSIENDKCKLIAQALYIAFNEGFYNTNYSIEQREEIATSILKDFGYDEDTIKQIIEADGYSSPKL